MEVDTDMMDSPASSDRHDFGGKWTDDKLLRLKKYLLAYTTIFDRNAGARSFSTTYVDAFAGTGYRTEQKSKCGEAEFELGYADTEADTLYKGSARIALEIQPPFKKYIFIDKDRNRARELTILAHQFREDNGHIEIRHQEATEFFTEWCANSNWRKNRAVVFLDPYGMQVEWDLLASIARTEAIDLWLLFPLGIGVNRLLPRNELPPTNWATRLTKLFGTDEWLAEFYRIDPQGELFVEEPSVQKTASFNRITRYYVRRLRELFPGVADNPLPLYNSKNNPMFLLCFACSNKKGATTAVRIAQHVLKG